MSIAKPRLLFLDDEVIWRRFAAFTFPEERYELITAGTYSDLVELVAEHQPDVLIMDIFMPGTDGPESIKRLKSSPYKDVPVLLLSATDHVSDVARQCGADASLVKGGSQADLVNAVTRLLDKKAVAE